MQNAIESDITLSIMKIEISMMFDQEAFSVPDSFNEEDIDIFAELGVSSGIPNNNLTSNHNQQEENEDVEKTFASSSLDYYRYVEHYTLPIFDTKCNGFILQGIQNNFIELF